MSGRMDACADPAAIRVEEEDVAAVVDNRRGAIDLSDRGLSEDGASLLEVLFVGVGKVDPMEKPRAVRRRKVLQRDTPFQAVITRVL